MKKQQLLLLCAICSMFFLYAQDQYKIVFSYDSAGNQILRDRVCVNCEESSVVANDSTIVANLKMQSELFNDSKEEPTTPQIFAFPNPVTNLLRVEWVISTYNYVEKIALFSGGGQQLFNTQINSTQSGVDLSFSQYPPGNYVVVLYYVDAKRESFQVIKK